jgi:hypothetical protein
MKKNYKEVILQKQIQIALSARKERRAKELNFI